MRKFLVYYRVSGFVASDIVHAYSASDAADIVYRNNHGSIINECLDVTDSDVRPAVDGKERSAVSPAA